MRNSREHFESNRCASSLPRIPGMSTSVRRRQTDRVPVFGNHSQSFGRTRGLKYPVTLGAEQGGGKLPHRGIILNQKYRLSPLQSRKIRPSTPRDPRYQAPRRISGNRF